MKTIVTLVMLSIAYAGFSQVNFTGYLIDENESRLKGVTINLYSSNQIISTKSWSKKFEYDLDMEKYYTLELVKEGFETKRIAISTFEGDKNAEPFMFMMELVKAKEGEEGDDFPSALIKYKKNEGSFNFDVKYAKDSKKNSH